jgi:hypothetical protein
MPNNIVVVRLVVTAKTFAEFSELLSFLKTSDLLPNKIWQQNDYSMLNNKGFQHKNFGFEISGGASVEGTSLTNIGISAGGGRIGIGIGGQISIGVSTTTTIASPTIGEIWEWIASPFR